METINILLACRQTLVRQSWNVLLSSYYRIRIVGESTTPEQTIALAPGLQPDVVVVDLDLSDAEIVRFYRHLRAVAPHSRVIAVSGAAEPLLAQRVLEAGVMGYITRHSPVKELFGAIIQVSHGNPYICSSIIRQFTSSLFQAQRVAPRASRLTHREIEIIRMVRQGRSSTGIAEELSVSPKTVERHRYNILKKLQVKSTVSLINLLHQHQVC